jgi:hypothetical protein
MVYAHVRYLGKGKLFKVKAHYEKQYTVPTGELTRQLTQCYGSLELAEKLRRGFPRHYRDQCRGLLSLKKQFSESVLQEAGRIALENDCVKFGIIQSIARRLLGQHEAKAAQVKVPEGVQMPLDMELEERVLTYYSGVWGVSG